VHRTTSNEIAHILTEREVIDGDDVARIVSNPSA